MNGPLLMVGTSDGNLAPQPEYERTLSPHTSGEDNSRPHRDWQRTSSLFSKQAAAVPNSGQEETVRESVNR